MQILPTLDDNNIALPLDLHINKKFQLDQIIGSVSVIRVQILNLKLIHTYERCK